MTVELVYKMKVDKYRVYSSGDSPFCLLVEEDEPFTERISVSVDNERGALPVQELHKADKDLPRHMRRVQSFLRV